MHFASLTPAFEVSSQIPFRTVSSVYNNCASVTHVSTVYAVHSSRLKKVWAEFMGLAAPARDCPGSSASFGNVTSTAKKRPTKREGTRERKRTSRRQQNAPLRNPGDRLTRRRRVQRIRSCEPRGVSIRCYASKNILYLETCSIGMRDVKFEGNNWFLDLKYTYKFTCKILI